MQATLIDQGINLMLYGMGTVFVFLTILVFATALMSRIIGRLQVTGAAQANSGKAALAGHSGQPSPQVLAAIKLAIALHRDKK